MGKYLLTTTTLFSLRIQYPDLKFPFSYLKTYCEAANRFSILSKYFLLYFRAILFDHKFYHRREQQVIIQGFLQIIVYARLFEIIQGIVFIVSGNRNYGNICLFGIFKGTYGLGAF